MWMWMFGLPKEAATQPRHLPVPEAAIQAFYITVNSPHNQP